jgi:hypothetical protein
VLALTVIPDGVPLGKLDLHFLDGFFNFLDGDRTVTEFQLSSSA